MLACAVAGVGVFASAGHADAAVTTFNNTASIAIPAVGAATPFPSAIAVSGLCGTVSKATVSLNGLDHTFPDDIDALLVAPGGQKTLLMSDVGGLNSVSGLNLTFDDAAANSLPDTNSFGSGTYKPTDYAGGGGDGDVFSSPAPAGPYVASLAQFNGAAANGTWQLFVQDDSNPDGGQIAGGWTLNLSTPDCAPTPTTAPGTVPVLVPGPILPGFPGGPPPLPVKPRPVAVRSVVEGGKIALSSSVAQTAASLRGGVVSTLAKGGVTIPNKQGFTARQLCGGRYRIKVYTRKGGKLLASRAAIVSRVTCRFSKRFKFPARRLSSAQKKAIGNGRRVTLYMKTRFGAARSLQGTKYRGQRFTTYRRRGK